MPIDTARIGTLLFVLSLCLSACAERPISAPPHEAGAPSSDKVWTTEFAGTKLDLTGYRMTFDDEFNSAASISADGGNGPWFAPIHTQVGSASFKPPANDPSPFSVKDGVLTIRDQLVNGEWQTGHMQTSDSAGRGFSQTYGYFETRIKFPPPGTWGAWPAFWLYTSGIYTDPKQTRGEIDVIEYYPGQDPSGYHSAIHLRAAADPQVGQPRHWWVGKYVRVPALADGGWHTHGVMVTPQWIIVYFDGVELKRFPMLPELAAPLFMLIGNQQLPKEQGKAVSPIDMQVDYVRVYAKE